jgi:hypothetical protein
MVPWAVVLVEAPADDIPNAGVGGVDVGDGVEVARVAEIEADSLGAGAHTRPLLIST